MQQPPYQPYNQPPQMPPRQKGVMGWVSRQHIAVRIVLIFATIFCGLFLFASVCRLISAVVPGMAVTPTATVSTDAATATAFVVPTDTPFPILTDTPVPAVAPTQAPSGLPATHNTPRLGSTLSDFIGAYGQPNAHSNPPDYHFLTTGNVDGIIILGLGPSCPSTQCVGEQKIDDVSVQATTSTGWTLSDAQLHCLAYMPTDAHLKQRVVFADGTGYDVVYFSASLAKLFPASEFTDASGNPAPPGIFDISYLYRGDHQHIDSCDLITGSQQTNG